MTKKILVAMAVFGVAWPIEASAAKAWLRVNASTCVRPAQGGLSGWSYGSGVSDVSSADAICPYLDQNELQRDDLEKLNVYLYDSLNTAEAEVQLCRRSFTSSSGSCGPATGTGVGFTGYRTVGLSSGLSDSAWQNTSGVAYIHLSGFGFQYRGYYAENDINATPIDTFKGQAAFCSPRTDDDFHDNIGTPAPHFSDGYFAGGRTSGGDGADLICSYPERNGMQRDDLTDLTVYGSDSAGADSFTVQLCRAAYGNGGSCGAVEQSNAANVELDLGDIDASAWSVTTGTAYMQVHVPRTSNGFVDSYFRGFHLEAL